MKQYIHQVVPHDRPVTLLEVGVDRGVSLVPLVAFLARTRPEFMAMGVDIKLQEQVQLVLMNLDPISTQHVYYVEGNSLDVLPKMVDQGMKFDVVMLDGDHNYHTVAKEMSMLENLTYPSSLIVIDDYSGRWAEKDLWYAEREGYETNKHATQRSETDQHGVKAAVDEWLVSHPEWQKAQPIPGEAIILMRKVT